MRLAIVADIHGNAVALDAVVTDLQNDGVDDVVCLGDVAATGPQPAAVVERLMELKWPAVMGNADDELLHPRLSGSSGEDTRRIEEISAWCIDQLTPDQLDYLESFVPTLRLSLDGGRTLLCYHGSPGSFDDTIAADTPADELDRMLAGVDADVMAGGHTHFAMLRRHGATLVVNPGSVGLAYDRTAPVHEIRAAPWAEYAILTSERDRVSVDFRCAAYDPGPLVEAGRAGGMPHAEWWVAGWKS